jgi:hypothetical protein
MNTAQAKVVIKWNPTPRPEPRHFEVIDLATGAGLGCIKTHSENAALGWAWVLWPRHRVGIISQ